MPTPLQVLTTVRNQLVETTAAFWTNAELYYYMSEAQQRVAQELQCTQKSTATSTVTDTSGYAIPSDCVNITYLRYNKVPLKQIDQREYDSLSNIGYSGTVATGSPTHYFLIQNTAYLYPTPDASRTLQWYYNYIPADVVSGTSAFEVPVQYHTLLQNYVLYRAFAKDQDTGKTDFFKREWEESLAKAKLEEQKRRWAGGFPRVKTTDFNYTTYDGIV